MTKPSPRFWQRPYWRLYPLEWICLLCLLGALVLFEECARHRPPPALTERAS